MQTDERKTKRPGAVAAFLLYAGIGLIIIGFVISVTRTSTGVSGVAFVGLGCAWLAIGASQRRR